MPSSEQDFRHACEVRDLFDRSRFPTRAALAAYFSGVKKKRGKESAQKLREDYQAEFNRRNAG